MDPGTLLLYLLCMLAVAGGVATVALKHPVHCALGLLGAMLALAGAYAMMQAHLLAALQIIIYAGAIIILVIYVIMLLDSRAEEFGSWVRLSGLLALPVVGLLLLVLGGFLRDLPNDAAPALAEVPVCAGAGCEASCTDGKDDDGDGLTDCADPDCGGVNRCYGTTRAVGAQLLGPSVLAFEASSILLLAGMVGAVLLTARKPRAPGEAPSRLPMRVSPAAPPEKWEAPDEEEV